MEASRRCVGRMVGEELDGEVCSIEAEGEGVMRGWGVGVVGIRNGEVKMLTPAGSAPMDSGFQSLSTPPSVSASSMPPPDTRDARAAASASAHAWPASPFVACDMSKTNRGRRCLPSALK